MTLAQHQILVLLQRLVFAGFILCGYCVDCVGYVDCVHARDTRVCFPQGLL